ncbi:unnamed protein product, partial [Musa banksii]
SVLLHRDLGFGLGFAFAYFCSIKAGTEQRCRSGTRRTTITLHSSPTRRSSSSDAARSGSGSAGTRSGPLTLVASASSTSSTLFSARRGTSCARSVSLSASLPRRRTSRGGLQKPATKT